MREDKEIMLSSIQEWLKKSPYMIVIDYTGVKVAEFSELRNRLSKVGAEVHVVKNTFLKRALTSEKLPIMEADLTGQTALVYGASEVSVTAKILKNFAAEFQKPKIRSAIVDKVAMDHRGIMALADLPSREVLLAQLLGLINSPATRLARLIKTPAGQLAQVVKAKSEKS